MQLSQKERT